MLLIQRHGDTLLKLNYIRRISPHSVFLVFEEGLVRRLNASEFFIQKGQYFFGSGFIAPFSFFLIIVESIRPTVLSLYSYLRGDESQI